MAKDDLNPHAESVNDIVKLFKRISYFIQNNTTISLFDEHDGRKSR